MSRRYNFVERAPRTVWLLSLALLVAAGNAPAQGVTGSFKGTVKASSGAIVPDAIGKQNYQGLQATVRKRLSQGLEFNSSYTWSHAFCAGLPLTVGETPDTSNAGSLAPRPDAIRDSNLPSGKRGPDLWFDPTAFRREAPNTFGNAGVGTIVDPGIANIDFAMQKRFRFSETKHVEFRAEAFNLFNTPLFPGRKQTLGSATFGKVTSSPYERELQMASKSISNAR